MPSLKSEFSKIEDLTLTMLKFKVSACKIMTRKQICTSMSEQLSKTMSVSLRKFKLNSSYYWDSQLGDVMRKTLFLYHFKIIFVSQLSFVVEKRLSDKIYIWGEPRI